MDDLLAELARAPSAKPRSQLGRATIVGEYRIIEAIGRGAFGTVYRAEHPVIGKEVAIKVLDGARSDDERLVERFVSEARAVNRIKHRNIVDIFGFGELDNGQKFYVMELLRGETLADMLKRERPSPSQALAILEFLADALDAAHRNGILHRDLKPANVFLQRESNGPATVKLLDFGVAKILESDSAITTTGVALGTPAYMAPEQYGGERVTAAADIYALGVVAYELMTGSRPFSSTSTRELMKLHVMAAPTPASVRLAALPGSLDEPIARMLEKEPWARPSSCREAVRALRLALDGEPQPADESPILDIARPPPMAGSAATMGAESTLAASTMHAGLLTRRHVPRPFLATLGAALLLGGLGLLWAWKARTSPELGSAVAEVARPQLPASGSPAPSTPANAVSAVAVAPTVTKRVTVQITLRGLPSSAIVRLDGRRVASGPQPFALPLGERALKLEVSAPGFASRTVSLVPDRDRVENASLSKRATPPGRPRLSPLELDY